MKIQVNKLLMLIFQPSDLILIAEEELKRTDMSFYLLFAPIIPLLLLLAPHTKSRITRFTLKALSIWLFIAILNGAFLEYDCVFSDFSYGRCDILTTVWAESLTLFTIINLLFGSFIFPGILTTLGLYELYLRKFKK